MLPPARSLTILAAIAAIRGRHAEAAELSRVAERFGTDQRADLDVGAVRDALARIRERGAEVAIEEARAELPRDLRQLSDSTRLGVERVASLHRITGATSCGELLERLRRPQVAAQFEADHIDAIRKAVARTCAERPRLPLGRAWSVLDSLFAAVRGACPEVGRLEATGSVRRFAATTGELELLVESPEPARTSARLLGLPSVSTVLHARQDRLVLRFERAELTIRIASPDVFVPKLVHLTGSTPHVLALEQQAAALGFTLTPDSLTGPEGRVRSVASEEDLYATLALEYVPPELREGTGELEAAARGELPDLLRREQIRGDLHMHTDWSDGHDSIELMVLAAEALGYEYVAITDHSRASAIARGLDIERLERQMDVVAAARETHPELTILHGSEVDILPDGRLDFPDDVLERLDVVLASLHDPVDHSGPELTARYVRAMQHPLVQIVTHPTNRFVPGRAGYALDERMLFEAAVETRTILEIDGAPGHLDMDGAMARRALAAGVTVSVDGDCHRATLLGRHMDFAVATARRGWVTAARVVNTLPLEGLRSRLARKRQSG
jgi:DNA polymerase (family 10)